MARLAKGRSPKSRSPKSQRPLEFYGKGIHKVKSGHLRYSSPKELRGEYVHRHIVKQLIEVTPYSVQILLPWPYEVHHMDYNKENNDPGNLLIVSVAFHSTMTADRKRNVDGTFGYKFHPSWKPAPDYVLFDDKFDDKTDEVPF